MKLLCVWENMEQLSVNNTTAAEPALIYHLWSWQITFTFAILQRGKMLLNSEWNSKAYWKENYEPARAECQGLGPLFAQLL